mmetsp:Transcript_52149/g.162053  ORF Transcript_52149/g.162053 Transcript_52149/m.162053 type:complete len:100 (+) Transcript_52149:330-629(+)
MERQVCSRPVDGQAAAHHVTCGVFHPPQRRASSDCASEAVGCGTGCSDDEETMMKRRRETMMEQERTIETMNGRREAKEEFCDLQTFTIAYPIIVKTTT